MAGDSLRRRPRRRWPVGRSGGCNGCYRWQPSLVGLRSTAAAGDELAGVAGAGTHRVPPALVVLAPARSHRSGRAAGRLAIGVVDEAVAVVAFGRPRRFEDPTVPAPCLSIVGPTLLEQLRQLVGP